MADTETKKQYLDIHGLTTYDGKIKAEIKKVDDAVKATDAKVGTLSDLDTTAKSDLVGAINEVRGAVSAGGTAAAITITSTTTTEGALKSYTVKQGDTTVGVIDIPKDMVVTNGEVVVDPDGKTAGTYIKLEIANVAEPLYINVGSLVDIYHAAASAAQVQIAINSSTREISATIVAGSIGTTELADDGVTTAKIADTNVTKAKLSTEVQASIDKADSAVQAVASGSGNGTIAVDGTDVAVKGLDTAAYAKTTDFDAAGAASTAETNAKDYADELMAKIEPIPDTAIEALFA